MFKAVSDVPGSFIIHFTFTLLENIIGSRKDEFTRTLKRTTAMFTESKCTYEKEGVMNLCQIDWLMLHIARNYGAFLTSLHFIGTIRVPYAKGGLKGSI